MSKLELGRRLVGTVYLVGLSLSVPACYLHSPTRLALAEQAQAQFAEVAENPPYALETTRFSALVTSANEVADHLFAVQRDAMIAKINSETLEDLDKAARNRLAKATTALVDETDYLELLKDKFKKDLIDGKLATGDAQDYQAALNAAELAKQRFEATELLLRRAIVIAIERDEKEPNYGEFVAVLGEPVGDSTTGADAAAASPLASPVGRASSTNTVGKVLGIDPTKAEQALKKAEDGTLGVLEALSLSQDVIEAGKNLRVRSPGATTVLLGLGADIARIERERAANQVAHMKRRIALQDQLIEIYKSEIRDLEDEIRSNHFGRFDPKKKVRDTLDAIIASNDPNKHATLRSFYMALWHNFARWAQYERSHQQAETNISAVEAEHELRESLTRLHERELYIGRGLEGLVEFHRGGFGADQLNLILQAAQAIGIGVLIGVI